MSHVRLYLTRFGLPISIVIAFLSVAVLAIVTFRNTGTLRDGERQVSKSHAIGEATHRLLSALKDMQTGERGYLITGKEIFLGPFEQGRIELDESWHKLSELTINEPDLRSQVASLKKLLDEKVRYLDQAVTLRRAQASPRPSDEVIARVRSEGGEKLMEAVREATNSILNKQAARLIANEQHSRELRATSYRAILLGNLIALAIISTTGAISYWDRRRRDESEASLTAKESELSAIFNSTSDAILTFDNQLHIRLINPSARLLLGFSQPADAIGSSLDALIHADTDENASKHFVSSDSKSCDFRGYGQRTDGGQFPSEGRFSKIDSNGKRYNILVFQDLTEIRRAESSRRELAAILDQVTDAIVVCDLHERIVSWNRGAEVLHGVAHEAAVGRPARELLCGTSSHIWDIGSKTILTHAVFSTEFEIPGQDKQKQWIEHRRSLIRDALGAPCGQLVMHIDITQRRQEEASQRRSQRLESIGTLAGGVAHDLNNILTPILMNAKLAQRSTTNQARLLEMIVISAERGGKMIKKLLAFAGGERASLELVNVRDVIREVQEILSHSLPKSVALEIWFADDLHHVQADPTELSQVIVNLAVNARDAMPDGGKLTISAHNVSISDGTKPANARLLSGDFVLLTVVDQGHGIAPDIQERIFDPFFTTKAQGKGTGLGLATSLGIARAYGGDISVESTPGQGSVFSVYLPIATGHETPNPKHADEQVERPGKGEVILLVDDEPNIVECACELLQNTGYRVLEAHSGAEALEKFASTAEPIDLVVLDMMMPDMDGVETKNRMRALRPTIKIIGSSGLRRPHIDAGLDNLDGFLTKPYTNIDLLHLVRQTLDVPGTKD